MKSMWRTIILTGAIAAMVPGFTASVRAFEVPKYVFGFDRLEEAQTSGFEDKKPLLLMLADPAKEPT